eukprot:gene15311-biopygen13089
MHIGSLGRRSRSAGIKRSVSAHDWESQAWSMASRCCPRPLRAPFTPSMTTLQPAASRRVRCVCPPLSSAADCNRTGFQWAAEQDRTGQDGTGQGGTEEDRWGQGRTGEVRKRHERSNQKMARKFRAGQGRAGRD